MNPIVILLLKCKKCGKKFVATSHIAYYADPFSKEPISCPECGSEDFGELDTLQVG